MPLVRRLRKYRTQRILARLSDSVLFVTISFIRTPTVLFVFFCFSFAIERRSLDVFVASFSFTVSFMSLVSSFFGREVGWRKWRTAMDAVRQTVCVAGKANCGAIVAQSSHKTRLSRDWKTGALRMKSGSVDFRLAPIGSSTVLIFFAASKFEEKKPSRPHSAERMSLLYQADSSLDHVRS